MNKHKQRAGRFLQRFFISLAALVLVFSNLLQLPVAKAAAATPTWTIDSSGTTYNLHGITYGNGQWVAVGDGKTILTSSDGIHWSSGNTTGITNNTLRQIAYDGSTWWIIDSSPDAFYSSSLNSSGWSGTGNFGNGNSPTGLAVSASSAEKMVVTDGTGFYVYNGTSWSSGPAASGPYGVIYANGKYVVVGSGQVQYSTDGGITWSPVSLGNGDILVAITYSGGQFVAVGSDQHVTTGVVYTSPDGITWTKQSVSVPIFNSVAGSGSGYIAVGNSGVVYSSPDGITWTKQSSGTTQNLNQVYYAGGRYVAVGDNGTIITQSTNANLASLSLSKGTLSPSFSPSTTSYTVSTADSSISVTASVYDNASLTVDGSAVTSGSSSGPIALAQKSNTIPIVVTAQDGMTQKTYTLTVNRIPPPTVTGLQHSNVTQTGWTESWGTVTGAKSYNVYLGGKNVGTVTQATYSFANAQPGTTYSVTIAAVNDLGQASTPSTGDSVTTLANVSGVPTHSNVTQTGWTESWGPVTGARSYDVYLNNTRVGSVTQAVYDFTGKQPGTKYTVTIASVNASGQASSPSSADNVITLYNTTGAPTGLAHSSVITRGWHETWNAVSGTSVGTVSYAVYLDGNKVGTTTSPSYDFTGMQPGTTYSVTIASVNGSGQASSKSATDTVTTAHPYIPLSVGTSFVWNGEYGVPYNPLQLHAVSGIGPYTWSVASGSLPNGLTLSRGGLITGTPTGPDGTSTFTVQVQATNGVARRTLSILIKGAPPVSIQTPTVVPTGQPGQSFEQTLTAIGGNPPYTWSIVKGTLPSGLKLNPSTGVVSGITTRKSPEIVTVAVQDETGLTQEKQVVIDSPPKNEREIVWETPSLTARNVPAVTGSDSGTQTTYMPIWYVMQLLKPLGIQSTWDGTKWHMATASKPDLSNLNAGNGTTTIYLNGTVVQKVNTVAAKDPSTGKATTYMPIWYVMQLLNRVGLHSTWNGTTWTVTK